jgi:hypothetical protein
MRSVADALRRADREALACLTPADRVALALSLGARDLERFRLAHDPPLDPAAAARVLERRRQAGRRPSRCLSELIG